MNKLIIVMSLLTVLVGCGSTTGGGTVPVVEPAPTSHTFEDGTTISDEGIVGNKNKVIQFPSDYKMIDMQGLEQAHIEGWTGAGVKIMIYDSGFYRYNGKLGHGILTYNIVKDVSPNSSIVAQSILGTSREFLENFSYNVTTHSYMVNRAADSLIHFRQVNADSPNAVHVKAVPNTSIERCGDEGQTITTCAPRINAIAQHAYSEEEGKNTGEWIFAGAYDANGGYNSAPVGDNLHILIKVKENYLVASGRVTVGEQTQDGTSFAAPRIAGAAALVISKFGTNAANTKQILFQTATDLGEAGVDNVYGNGLLNVGAALSPIGELN